MNSCPRQNPAYRSSGVLLFSFKRHEGLRGTSRDATVAALIMDFIKLLKWLVYFYLRTAGLTRADVSLQLIAKPINKGASAPSANRFAEPAWRTHNRYAIV